MSEKEKSMDEKLGYPVTSLGMMSNEENAEEVGEAKTDQEINIHPAEALTAVPASVSIMVGQTYGVRVKAEPEMSNCPEIVWETSDGSIAKVRDGFLGSSINECGMAEIIGIAEGSATITATSLDPALTCEIAVEVKDDVPDKYGIAISDCAHGSVATDKSVAEEGEEVTITVTPAEHFVLDELSVKDGEGKDVEVADNKFIMPASNVTVYATFKVEEVESDSYDYVYNEASWNASYANGGLKLYYEANPMEDLWNESAHRAANYNDRHYVGTIAGAAAECNVAWQSSSAQKLIFAEETYYAAIFYDFEPREVALFTDAELTESAEKTFVITEISYVNCVHCWEGAVNAPGAAYPWIVPHFDTDVDSTIRFEYEGKDSVMPWGSKVFGKGEGHSEWGAASVATEFNDASFKIVENGGEGAFDISKFKMILIPEV